jgi:L-2-hydroxyglutarate oxidase
MARRLREGGVRIRTSARVERVLRRPAGFVLQTSDGEVEARNLINCAGLQSDRIALMCGVEPGLRIVPFRGEYYELLPHRRHLVRNLVYPVPDLRLPFLGPHFTRFVDGRVAAGPNAVPTLSREGYDRWSFSASDGFELVTYGGFWRLAARNWRAGVGEIYRSLSKEAFARDLRKMIPDLVSADIRRDGAGVRAQAVTPDGTLVDDFRLLRAERMLHVLNAPSPAATASLSIGRGIAAAAEEVFTVP